MDNWEKASLDFQTRWIQEHVRDATRAGKPLVLEEFGKLRDGGLRDEFYRQAYTQVGGARIA